MIVIDPALFVKCRLCLGAKGQYQIGPSIQMQIKYCFDIDVEPSDGLPQLICKKCQSIVGQYTGIKQIFQEKQKILKSNLSADVLATFTQSKSKNKNPRIIRSIKKPKVSTLKTLKCKITQNKELKSSWKSTYTKYFVCRFCHKSFEEKTGFDNHISQHCKMYNKYSNKIEMFCLVELNKIGTKRNKTNLTDTVVLNENKIIESKKSNYYILYSKELDGKNDLSYHDTRLLVNKNKRECVEIKNTDDKKVICHEMYGKDTPIISGIKRVRKDYSKSISTKSCVNLGTLATVKNNFSNSVQGNFINITIENISKNYIQWQQESSHDRKVINAGIEVTHTNEFTFTRLMKLVEQKNIDVIWVPRTATNVSLKTIGKEETKGYCNDLDWDIVTSLNLKFDDDKEDFADVFECILEEEACNNKFNTDTVNTSLPRLKNSTEGIFTVFKKLAELETHTNKNDELLKTSCQEKKDIEDNQEKETFVNPSGIRKHNKRPATNLSANKDTKINKIILNNLLNTNVKSTKLLNANPVLNPKKLPKKSCSELEATAEINPNKDSDYFKVAAKQTSHHTSNSMTFSPCQKSALQSMLRIKNKNKGHGRVMNGSKNNNRKVNAFKKPKSLGKIKCKPISALMSDMALSQQSNSASITTNLNIDNEPQRKYLTIHESNTSYYNNTNDLLAASRHHLDQDLLLTNHESSINLLVVNSGLNVINTQAQPCDNLHNLEIRYFQI